MKYKLTKYDVLKLYPEMTPYEIKEEFGERSPSVKQIYNMTNGITRQSASKRRKERMQRWIEKRPPQVSIAEVKEMVQIYSDELKEIEIQRLWEDIKEFEGRF